MQKNQGVFNTHPCQYKFAELTHKQQQGVFTTHTCKIEIHRTSLKTKQGVFIQEYLLLTLAIRKLLNYLTNRNKEQQQGVFITHPCQQKFAKLPQKQQQGVFITHTYQ